MAAVFVEQEAKEAHLRELRRAPEASELRVVLSTHQRADGVDDVRGQLAALRLARRRLLLAQLRDTGGDLLAFGGPHLIDAVQRLPHRLRRDVGAAVDDLALRREEDGAGPAAHVVAAAYRVAPLFLSPPRGGTGGFCVGDVCRAVVRGSPPQIPLIP